MSDLRSDRIELELTIEAPRPLVWETLVDSIGDWWPPDYLATERPDAFHFEARPGGAVWEETGTGGLQWFTVQALERERWVNLAGFLAPPWGGPAVTTLRLELHDQGEGKTLLRATDASFGQLGDCREVEAGWRAIFEGLHRLAAARAGSAAGGGAGSS